MTHSKSSPALRVIVAVLVLVGTAVTSGRAWAATITLTTNLDAATGDGLCSLREAIIAANGDRAVDACPAGSGTDTILLPAGVYPLSIPGRVEPSAYTGDLDLFGNLILLGAGPGATTIDGAGLDRIFELHPGAAVQITGVTLTNGDAAAEGGGAVLVDGGQLTLTDSVIQDSHGGQGGGIGVDHDGIATLIKSRLSSNTALSGGGLYVANYPGAATAVVIDSLIDGNSASGSVGGSSGGGVRSAAGGDVTLINTTISGNRAALHGGGIYVDNVVRLVNVTITANVADSDEDDLGNGGGVAISNGSPAGFATARNSLVAANVDASPTAARHANCSGTLTGEGYDLLGVSNGCTVTGDATGNIVGVAPFLGPLQDNGGPTFTHALLSNSVAIDSGDPVGCLDAAANPLTTDQRGYIRPIDGNTTKGARCDIGAFEYGSSGSPEPTSTVIASPTSSSSSTAASTVTAAATSTSSRTPTAAISSTASSTPSRTATAPGTPLASATPTRTLTYTAPSPTVTATVALPSGTPTPTRTGSPSAPLTPTAPPAPTLTAVATSESSPDMLICAGFCLALPEVHRP